MLPTAKNRMCNAEPTEMDYSGMNTQTTLFVKDALQYNISVTEQFLKSLGIWKPSVDGSARIWLKVERPVVWNYLRSMRFHENSVVFSDIEPFIQWFEEVRDDAGYADWNVVLGGVLGPGKEDDRWVPFDSWKVERKIAKRSSNKDYIVKVMRAPRDLLVDAFFADTIQGGLKNSDVLSIRASHGVGSSPQLLLYRIKRDAGKSDAGRVVPEHDLIGASIWIPGVRNSRANSKFTRMLSVKLPGIALDEEKPEGD